MKPVLIQHLIRQLKRTRPNRTIEETTARPQSKWPTIFVLLLALIILIVALE